MRDFLVSITCPYSTLNYIAGALNLARIHAKCAHDEDEIAEFQHAHKLAYDLCVNGILTGDPALNPSLSYIDTEEQETPVVAF